MTDRTGNIQPSLDRHEHESLAKAKRTTSLGMLSDGSAWSSHTLYDYTNSIPQAVVLVKPTSGDPYDATTGIAGAVTSYIAGSVTIPAYLGRGADTAIVRIADKANPDNIQVSIRADERDFPGEPDVFGMCVLPAQSVTFPWEVTVSGTATSFPVFGTAVDTPVFRIGDKANPDNIQVSIRADERDFPGEPDVFGMCVLPAQSVTFPWNMTIETWDAGILTVDGTVNIGTAPTFTVWMAGSIRQEVSVEAWNVGTLTVDGTVNIGTAPTFTVWMAGSVQQEVSVEAWNVGTLTVDGTVNVGNAISGTVSAWSSNRSEEQHVDVTSWSLVSPITVNIGTAPSFTTNVASCVTLDALQTPRLSSSWAARGLTVGTSDVQLTSVGTPVHGVMIKAASDNTVSVFLGHSTGVTTSANQATTGIELEPGQGLVIEVDDADAVYAIASAASQSIQYGSV